MKVDKIELDKLPTQCSECSYFKYYNDSFSYCVANCENNSYEEFTKNKIFSDMTCRRSDCKLVEKNKKSTEELIQDACTLAVHRLKLDNLKYEREQNKILESEVNNNGF